ncbi:Hypothetical protein SCF082_LOCUS27420 [Durusdinium trenchii]|uniref:AB hydrolase-1 domain-containing protein n=1 Tax=Durusdinium trenchii TaxID=1381693 RepID=A0ABP0MFG6_9DINO
MVGSMVSVVEELGELPFEGSSYSFNFLLPSDWTGVDSGAPRLALLFLHGFTRDRLQHRAMAARLAHLNMAVLLPDLPSLLRPSFVGYMEESRSKCVRFACVAARWLAGRVGGYVPLALGGFSAGGAVALEAAVNLQEQVILDALILVDAVPWPRTCDVAGRLQVRRVMLAESEPSSFNMYNAFRLQVIPKMMRPPSPASPSEVSACKSPEVKILRVAGSNHIDAENAGCEETKVAGDERQNYNGWFTRWIVGRPNTACQEAFYQLVAAFLQADQEALEASQLSMVIQ